MNLLENSQTFLGVLLTLNVLCIFYEKHNQESSNFILRMLHDLKQKLSDRIQNLLIESDKTKKEFFDSDDYKSVEKLCSDMTKSQQIRDEANALRMSASLGLYAQSSKITETEARIDYIEHSNEQIRGPFYSLIFGVVIFVIDEIFHFEGTLSPYLLFGTYVFTILSSVYWLIIWITFFVHTSKPPHKMTGRGAILEWIDRKLGVIWGSIAKFILCGIIYTIVLIYVPIDEFPVWLQTLIIGGAFTIPITLIGVWRMVACPVKGNYSLIHVSGHLIGFILFSILIGGITACLGLHNVSNSLFFLNNRLLTLIIVIFVLLVGLVLPFVLPYVKYQTLYNINESEIKRDKENTFEIIKDFETQFSSFCVRIIKEEQKHPDPKSETKALVKIPETTAVAIDWTAYIKEYEGTPNRPSIETYCRRKNIDQGVFRALRNKYLHPARKK